MGVEFLELTFKVIGQKIIWLEQEGLQGTGMSHIKWWPIPITITYDFGTTKKDTGTTISIKHLDRTKLLRKAAHGPVLQKPISPSWWSRDLAPSLPGIQGYGFDFTHPQVFHINMLLLYSWKWSWVPDHTPEERLHVPRSRVWTQKCGECDVVKQVPPRYMASLMVDVIKHGIFLDQSKSGHVTEWRFRVCNWMLAI